MTTAPQQPHADDHVIAAADAARMQASGAPAPPCPHELVLRSIPMPADTNMGGTVFGGWMLSQLDLAGAVVPYRLARGRIATVGLQDCCFHLPIRVGDLLSFYAHVVRLGTSSITVHVQCFAESPRFQGKPTLVAEAKLSFVALDKDDRPRNWRVAV